MISHCGTCRRKPQKHEESEEEYIQEKKKSYGKNEVATYSHGHSDNEGNEATNGYNFRKSSRRHHISHYNDSKEEGGEEGERTKNAYSDATVYNSVYYSDLDTENLDNEDVTQVNEYEYEYGYGI